MPRRRRRAPHPPPVDTQATKELLERVPQNPRPIRHVTNWPLALQSVAEYVANAPAWLARVSGRVSRYPKPFRKVTFDSRDGTEISAWLGYHTSSGGETVRGSRGDPESREGVLIVPGMFTSKNMTIQKARSLKIFRDLGYHVLTMDVRGFGESSRTYNSGGWRESEDIEAAIDYFHGRVPLEKLHVYSESLGATATLTAAGRLGRKGKPLVDGSILAVSPFGDLRTEILHLDSKASLTDEYYMIQWFFRQLLRLEGHGSKTFGEYLEEAAEDYGTDVETLYDRGSPLRNLDAVRVPTLILHSHDDPVVPNRQADQFAHALEGQRNPVLWRLPWGSHCLYEMADPDWFWTVLAEFFDFACLLPPQDA